MFEWRFFLFCVLYMLRRHMKRPIHFFVATGVAFAALLLALPFAFPLSGNAVPDWVSAIGRFHILFLHFPIGLILIVPLLEWLGTKDSMRHLEQSVPTILFLSAASAFAACILGYLLAAGEGDSGGLLTRHMWGGIIATVLVIAALLLRTGCTAKKTYWLALLGCIASLFFGSHNGASMVHGTDFIHEKLPPAIQHIFGGEAKSNTAVSMESPAYATLVEPIFENHCYVCHNEGKSKGGFRLDDFALMLEGGDSGMAGIEPGDLEESEVYYRITLQPSAKAFMPPEGNLPLSEGQKETIAWWIQTGASETATIGELAAKSYPDNIKHVVDALLGAN